MGSKDMFGRGLVDKLGGCMYIACTRRGIHDTSVNFGGALSCEEIHSLRG